MLVSNVLVKYTGANDPCCSSLLVTECESTAMSEAVVMEPPRAGGFLESSCGPGDSAASLDDVAPDAAKYVHTNTATTVLSYGRTKIFFSPLL